MKKSHALIGAALLIGVGAFAINAVLAAQAPAAGGGLWSTLPAPSLPMTGNELGAFDTELSGGAYPQTEGVTVNNLITADAAAPSRGNAIIGGDATTNLWQRSTSGTATTSGTPAYDGPDRWAQASLSSSSWTLARDSASTDVFPGYQYSFKLSHGNTTAGQGCMMQVVESANSYQFAGQTAELDFHAYTGAGMSAAAPYNMTAYIVTGAGTDEGVSKMSYTINTGYGATGWTTGAIATAAVIPLGAVSTGGRYSAVATIPAGTTEIGVALCYTAGTTDTNDYIAFAGIQLVRAPSNAAYASATAGYNDVTSGFQAYAFERRQTATEALLQYRYFYQINEADTANVIQGPGGFYDTTTTCSISFPLPAPMLKSPTLNLGNLATTTFKIAPTTTPVVLATPYALLQVGSTPAAPFTQASVSFKTTAETQYVNCDLVSTAAGAGYFAFNAEE